jgi:membrane protease YdiL (CAAX protease family)
LSPVTLTAVVAAGCAALVMRPLLGHVFSDPSTPLVLLFGGLLALGLLLPASAARQARVPAATSVIVLGVGIGAFVVGRLIGGLPGVAAVGPRYVAMNTLAALAEEAFFRRLLYARLESDGGPLLAIGGTTLLFTIVHVTVYGAWALPIDAAAGLLLGWQRWASGSWRVPAVTHVIANVLMVV